MTNDYEPTPDQRNMIAAAVDTAIMPLIRQVLIKKLGQAAVFMKEEIDARYQPLSDLQIEELYFGELDNRTLSFARAIERHVRGV